MTTVQMGGLVQSLGVGGVLCVPREGFFGGLCILWKTGLQVVLLSSFSGHIDARVDIGPWMCCGDFNEIMSVDEKSGLRLRSVKSGLRLRSVSQIEDFQRAIDDCNLLSFDFMDHFFTWTNNRKNYTKVQARLDRGFGNLALLQQWGNSTIYHLSVYSSDHHPP
ncbi:hypothetical protein L3X38_017288 [Prunus dulcis]|uniref:DNAse I-like superfamily protein n=1 Tax=Prunus dulcis TaxID=3755 RepID=A0AAD4Z912_PRUDU|nr:hypothetical protein L3X38_017288 [Prunus dulcis]